VAGKKPSAVLDALAADARLRGFLRDGRIDVMPAKHSRRLEMLTEVAQVFEPGIRYSEREVNELLGALFDDFAALRRYLVDEEFLDRQGGEYWRIGGPVTS
jgi:hypothetical protein